MEIFPIALIFIFISGLCIGSFLNVVILRTVSGESIVFPGSKCPKCQNKLKWYHNIPLFSYIFLRGKCAFCKEKISIQYPIVELLTGIIFVALGFLYLNKFELATLNIYILLLMLIMSLIVASLMIIITGTDIIEMKVSDKHTYSLIASGLIYSLIIGCIIFCVDLQNHSASFLGLFKPVLFTLFAIVVAFAFLEFLRRTLNYLLNAETFGDGDSYIFAGIAGSLTALSGITDLKFLSIQIFLLFICSVIFAVIITFPSYIKKLIINKKWLVLATMLAFGIYAPVYFSLGYSGFYDNTITLVLCTLLLVIIGVFLCIQTVRCITDNSENVMIIPFGPALCITGLAVLLAMPYILGLI